MNHWHSFATDEVLGHFSTGHTGLDDVAAQRMLERVGPNRLAPPQPTSALRILADQFRSVVVYLLIAAIVISFALGDRIESIAIAAVLAINTIIGFATEFRARRAMEALLQFDIAKATVIRSGQLRSVDAATIVPGDIIQIDIGRRVPADARLIETTDFRTDEAALTGESLPVSKRADELLEEETPLADRTNMVYKGTTASAGPAIAVVTEHGCVDEIGASAHWSVLSSLRHPSRAQLDESGTASCGWLGVLPRWLRPSAPGKARRSGSSWKWASRWPLRPCPKRCPRSPR